MKVGNQGRIQKSLRSVKMRSRAAAVTPGSSVQSSEHQGKVGMCVCVSVYIQDIKVGVVLHLKL